MKSLEVYYFNEERYLKYLPRKIKTSFGEIELTANDQSWDYFYNLEYKKFEKFEKFDSFKVGEVTEMVYWETENDFIIEEIFLTPISLPNTGSCKPTKKYFSAKSMRYHMIKYKPKFQMNTRLLRELKLKELGI